MRKMRAVLAALTLITSGAEARGSEIYRNYTDKRDRCFEHSRDGRPAQRPAAAKSTATTRTSETAASSIVAA